MAIGVHVVGIDIGHHRHDRIQVQKRCIRFISLHHDVVTGTEFGIRTSTDESPANHESGVEIGGCQHTGDQTGGGGFAMRTCNGNALFQTHQLGQHHGARHHRHEFLMGRHHFRVVRLHGRGCDHRASTGNVRRIMTDLGANPHGLQASKHWTISDVGA